MLLGKQLYAALQFIHCMSMTGMKFTPEDLLAYVETVK